MCPWRYCRLHAHRAQCLIVLRNVDQEKASLCGGLFTVRSTSPLDSFLYDRLLLCPVLVLG